MSLEAFKMHVLPVKNKLYRFALSLLKSEDEARDIVQEVLIKIWKKQEENEQIDNVEAWCMRVTRNMSLDRLKSKRVKFTDSLTDGFDVSGGDNHTPYRTMETSDTMTNIRRLISSLPEKQRQVIQLRDVEGYSYKEIVEILEMDMNQVKVNLFRARKALKQDLQNINAYGLE